MKASDIIKALQERIEVFGDWEVIFRETDGDDDVDILSVYADDETKRIVVSDFPDF